MSLEAWGDEGDIATRWEETAMAQDFFEVLKAFQKWKRDQGKNLPGPDHDALAQKIEDSMDELSNMFTGEIG